MRNTIIQELASKIEGYTNDPEFEIVSYKADEGRQITLTIQYNPKSKQALERKKFEEKFEKELEKKCIGGKNESN